LDLLVARLTNQPNVALYIPIDSAKAVEDRIGGRKRLVAFGTNTALQLVHQRLELAAYHRFVALVVDQFLIDLTAEREEEIAIAGSQLLLIGADFTQQCVGLLELIGGQAPVGHAVAGSLRTRIGYE
jgi:hypothetical protein